MHVCAGIIKYIHMCMFVWMYYMCMCVQMCECICVYVCVLQLSVNELKVAITAGYSLLNDYHYNTITLYCIAVLLDSSTL